jgi:hypothetical protein
MKPVGQTGRRLPLLCASNSDGVSSFYIEPCAGRACHEYDRKREACRAGTETAEIFSRWFTKERDAALPTCPAAEQCAWNVAALKIGTPGCVPRRLGMICEHQGGEWNTFEMADPDDPCWGDAAEPA